MRTDFPTNPGLPLLLVLFDDMRVGEIEVDGRGGKPVMPEDFLNRCDLIKFARYDATSADSRLLLEEATRFVKGQENIPAAAGSAR